MVQQFRKKPVVISAVQFDGSNFDEIKEFGGDRIELESKIGSSANGAGHPQLYQRLTVATLEGPLNISTGDWVIKGTKGEFYPCKPDIFPTIYELADASGEQGIVDAMDAMCIESCSPDQYEAWEKLKQYLTVTRKGLKSAA